MSFTYVLGLGGTVDYESAWDAPTLSELATEYAIRLGDLDRERDIVTERDLVCSILAFARDGVGGEKHVSTAEVLTTFAERLHTEVTLGGTCVRAATALHELGLPSTVHLVSIDDTVRRLLPRSVRYLCSADRDSLDPHLIVQFPAGSIVQLVDGEVVSRHANRVIYVNDPWNRDLALHPRLGEEIAGADAILVSGLNSMQDRELLRDRLTTLRGWLRGRRRDAVVCLEDAGYHVPGFAHEVRDALATEIDVWSMNEDELQRWIGRDVDLLDAGDVAEALSALAREVPAPVRVVHTRHWALAHGRSAHRWIGALARGVSTAGTRYLHGDGFTAVEHRAVTALPPDPAHAGFATALATAMPDAVCHPGPRIEVPNPTTIGLGDIFVGGFLAALAPTTEAAGGL